LGCLENFFHRGHGHRFEMHPIPQALKAPGEPVNGALPPPLINIVAPELVIRFLTGEPMKDADHARVGHGDDGPRLPTACGETLIPRREISVLGIHGRMRQLGQDRVECSRGTNPRQAANWRPFLNWVASLMAARMAVALMGPIPGMVCSR
jgi:hypothetical protein